MLPCRPLCLPPFRLVLLEKIRDRRFDSVRSIQCASVAFRGSCWFNIRPIQVFRWIFFLCKPLATYASYVMAWREVYNFLMGVFLFIPLFWYMFMAFSACHVTSFLVLDSPPFYWFFKRCLLGWWWILLFFSLQFPHYPHSILWCFFFFDLFFSSFWRPRK